MRSVFNKTLVVVALALAVGVLGASAASAAEWYSSATPTTVEWRQGGVKLSEAAATKWKGPLWITDEVEKGVAITVKCEENGEGTAGPGTVDKETKLTLTECTVVNPGGEFCPRVASEAKALALPWHTELVGTKEGIHDTITSEGAAKPGFKFECLGGSVGRFPDECTAKTTGKLNTTITNVSAGVDATFAGNALTCSASGKSGTVEGTQAIEATKGGKLEADVSEGTFSKLTSSLTVKATSELKLYDKYQNMGLTCSGEAAGTIAAAGKGTISSYTVSHCTPIGECKTLRSYLSINLPWNTELAGTGSSIEDKIVSGGSGTPSYKFECETASGLRSDTCNLANPRMANGIEGDVTGWFEETKTTTTCKNDLHENEAYWQGSLTIDHPESVGAIKVQ